MANETIIKVALEEEVRLEQRLNAINMTLKRLSEETLNAIKVKDKIENELTNVRKFIYRDMEDYRDIISSMYKEIREGGNGNGE